VWVNKGTPHKDTTRKNRPQQFDLVGSTRKNRPQQMTWGTEKFALTSLLVVATAMMIAFKLVAVQSL
jgi:hypothetical protein